MHSSILQPISIRAPSLILAAALTAVLGSCQSEIACDCSVVPKLVVNPPRIEFDKVPLGTTATLLVNLTNAGMARLVISNVSVLSGSDVRLDQSNVLTTDCSDNARSGNLDTIVPGECAQVAILFSPTAIETVTTKLEITSDDPRSPTTTILITASTAADGGSPADAG